MKRMKKWVFIGSGVLLLVSGWLVYVLVEHYYAERPVILENVSFSDEATFIVSTTSHTSDQTHLDIFNREKKLDSIFIRDKTIKHSLRDENGITLASQLGQHYYTLSPERGLLRHPVGALLTAIVPTGKGKNIFVTNYGFTTTEDEEGAYKSGFAVQKGNELIENYSFSRGRINDAALLGDDYYLLNTVRRDYSQELLKVNEKGDIVKTIPLVEAGNYPELNFYHLIRFQDRLYVFGEQFEYRVVDEEDQMQTVELDEYGDEISQVLRGEKGIHVVYYNGKVITVRDQKTVNRITLQFDPEEPKKYLLKAIREGDTLHMLFNYGLGESNAKNEQYEGYIGSYDLQTGALQNKVVIPNWEGERVHTFELIPSFMKNEE